jgi:hypothetical protein
MIGRGPLRRDFEISALSMLGHRKGMRGAMIGLFGTCGNSTWRVPFVSRFRELGIEFFNPQVENWRPECADNEALHLKNDEIILFPITGETYGTGSLAETGFSIVQAISKNHYVIVMIEELNDVLMSDAVAYKESARARVLVKAHLAGIDNPNVFVVQNFSEMLYLALELHKIYEKLSALKSVYS